MKNKFCYADFVPSKSGTVLSLRSGMSVYEEGLYNGVPVSYGYNGSGYPLNVLSNCDTRVNPKEMSEPFCFNVEVNGDTVCRNMALEKCEKTEDCGGAIHLSCLYKTNFDSFFISENTVIDKTGIFSRSLTLINNTSSPLNISSLTLHGGAIERGERDDIGFSDYRSFENLYSIGYFDNDEWGREGEFNFHRLLPGSVNIDRCFNRSRFRHPAIFIKNNQTGDIFFSQVGFSGAVRFIVDLNAKALSNRCLLSYCAEITGHKPLICLKPGEKFETPQVHFGFLHGSLDDIVNANIAHLRQSVLNLPESDPASLLIGAGMGAEHDMSVDTTKAFARQMADMGAELFIIDAGWACPPNKETSWYEYNGINKIDKGRYPADSFKEMREYIRSLGLKFGMWLEGERYGRFSAVLKEHPEWSSENIYGEKAVGFINMANPEAARFVENEISRVIEEYDLDLLRVDYNVDGNEMFTFENGECQALRHCMAVNEMYLRLKKKYPGVIFENCAGGGGRTDVGLMRAFNHTWVSDNQKMPRSVEITNGMTMVLPPERVDRLFAGMGCHTRGDIASHLRNAMLTHMSLNVISPTCLEANADAMAFIKKETSLYKKYIRPMLPTSKIYHHTPGRESAENCSFLLMEVASESKDLSALTAFSLPCAGEINTRIYPKGINPSFNYTVYFDNEESECEMSGKEIYSFGLPLKIGSALGSELIIIKKK